MTDRQLRWLAVSVLVVSSALNYLDRMVLSALMPTLRTEFGIRAEDLGMIVAAFSLPYACASPFMGLLVDRFGLKWGAALVVGLWSAVGMGTSFAAGFGALMVCRALLGLAESGGIPVTGKGFAVYLEPHDRAMGAAISQIGLTVGTMAAPVLTEFLSARYGWRSAFLVTGLLGFVWIPLWLFTAGRVRPVQVTSDPVAVGLGAILQERRFLGLIAANVLAMTTYSLWGNWTTLFLVTGYGLSQSEANLRYVWIPPVFATLGGLFGGWLAQRLIRAGGDLIPTRIHISIIASVFVLATAAAPVAGSPALAIALVSLSLFATTCQSVNYYSIPLDLFGAGRAAFAVSLLTGVFGLMQVVLSLQIGRWLDRVGWQPVCLAVATLPLLSALFLKALFRSHSLAPVPQPR
jgi:ACS family hexuronate transporter-like MFS transporter